MARRDAGEVAKELRAIYTAPTAEAAFDALAAFDASPWDNQVPAGREGVRGRLGCLHHVPGLQPGGPQAALHDQRESLNYQLRKFTKARGHFPGDDAVVKLLWLAIINIEDKRARERLARRQATGKRSDQPARLVEEQRVMGWRDALTSSTLPTPAACDKTS